MSIEKIPPKFTDAYKPFADVDHEMTAIRVLDRVVGGEGTVRDNLRTEFDSFRATKTELIDRLISRGMYLEPVDDEMKCLDVDYSKLSVFNSATALALMCIEVLGDEMNVDHVRWETAWKNLPPSVDGPSADFTNNRPITPELCSEVGDLLMNNGKRIIEIMEPSYRRVVDMVVRGYPEVQHESELYYGSFGYVFGVGRVVLESLSVEARLDAATKKIFPNDKQFDAAFIQMLRWDRKIARAALNSSRT